MKDPVRHYGYKNVYTCQKCGGKTITLDLAEGVTPFMLGCRASGNEFECDGFAQSAMYRIPHDTPEHGWEWFRPVGSEYRKLSRAMKEHVDNGGLDIRKRADVSKSDDPKGYYRDSRGCLRRKQ
jgi:hypothetical protein